MGLTAYDFDFNLWAKEQACALREGRFGDLDLEHLVEEVEDLGGSDRRALQSWIIVLMAHLLKWEYQPERRSGSWRGSIAEHRLKIMKLLKELPSLKPTVEDVLLGSYEDSLQIAIAEADLDRDAFPQACPYNFEDLFMIEVARPPKTVRTRPKL